ncbi:MAG: bifunctional sugar-1-phosphate nucleotidylyltransferase/acetyltransferase [Halobacteriales archaeon]|nr:bifunctional sugar-1-phosphate nucleotidylyltransferase/acetyltransferase [Halobacteriales archaeon]
MQTVVLAAGEGTRMRPLTASRPKPMLPVAGRPLLAHVLDGAVAAGATRLVVVVGYEADAVRAHFGDEHRGVPVEYAVQATQAGTADAVRAARPHLEDAPFAVLAGDNLYDGASLAELFAGGPAVGAFEVDDPRPYGVFELDGDRVATVVEKPEEPPSSLVNASAYAFAAEALDWLAVEASERGEHELTDVLARQIEATDVRAVRLERWLDVGRPWELLAANEWKLGELERDLAGDVSEGAEVTGDVVVEAGATVRSGAVIEGPVLVESGAEIGPNAYVRGATAIGPDAKVGHAVEVKNSVLMAGATAGHLSYVGDSILGRDVNLGAGTVVANLRHDDGPVELTVKGERVSTGRRKFGVVLGDGAKTGIDTSLNAGVTLSAGATTGPGEAVTRDR